MTETVERESFSLSVPEGQGWRKRMRNILWRVLSPLPDRLYLSLKYRVIVGRWPDIDQPRTFTEKVQARKLRDRNPLYATIVDKSAAKPYVAGLVGDEHVIRACWTGTDLAEVDWDALPYPVVIKPTHASGLGAFLYTRQDAAEFARNGELATSWLAVDHARYNREWAYSQVKPQLLIEQMLLFGGGIPWDYRVFVFAGRVSHICLDIRKDNRGYAATYSADWEKLPFYDPDYLPLYSGDVARPANLDLMVQIAETLGAGMDFVRVDLYSDGEQIFVGELTLYPGGGFERFDPPEYDLIIGNKWPDGKLG